MVWNGTALLNDIYILLQLLGTRVIYKPTLHSEITDLTQRRAACLEFPVFVGPSFQTVSFSLRQLCLLSAVYFGLTEQSGSAFAATKCCLDDYVAFVFVVINAKLPILFVFFSTFNKLRWCKQKFMSQKQQTTISHHVRHKLLSILKATQKAVMILLITR